MQKHTKIFEYSLQFLNYISRLFDFIIEIFMDNNMKEDEPSDNKIENIRKEVQKTKKYEWALYHHFTRMFDFIRHVTKMETNRSRLICAFIFIIYRNL